MEIGSGEQSTCTVGPVDRRTRGPLEQRVAGLEDRRNRGPSDQRADTLALTLIHL